MTTLQAVELGVLGPLQVRRNGAPVAIPGAKPRAILTMLGLHAGSVVSADTLVELLWGEDPPRTAAKALQTHISSLRRSLGEGVVLTEGSGWTLAGAEIDASRYKAAARSGRDAVAAGDFSQAVTRFHQALALWRGTPELPAGQRGSSERTRWIEAHAALVEDRADALLATGRAAEIIGELEAAVADAPLRERRWGQLMLALYRAGRQGEALAAYQRARALLADQLGVDPGPELRRLEAAVVAQDAALDMPVAQQLSSVTRAVTFLLTDIEGSTAAWEDDADAMAVALARHDELVEQVVTSRGGRLVKTRGEGDATFSVFERPSAAAAAAIELQDAILREPWALRDPMRVRAALHTGEVELRDGDYFGRAVNRAARLRSLATGGQILCSGATAELVIDSLPDDVLLVDLGMRQLRNLPRPEHVFELRLMTMGDRSHDVPVDEPLQRPELPAVLTGPGPFVGRGRELARLLTAWQAALAGGTGALLIAGEPGVGKTRLAGEWSQQAYDQGAVVLYGRCDEDLGAPYQPFAEALRSLIPSLGAERLRGLRGVEALLPLVPGLTDVVPDIAAPTRADPDTERYALFDAVVALLEVASASAPVVLVLDDLHWAAKPTLLLLRHVLRFGERGRVQIVGTYRSTDLDRSHPLAAMLADLHRDGSADRLSLSGLEVEDVSAYVAEVGYDDEELARALASVTGGNPFFLIEALRHVDESGGVWDQSTLPQGVREAVSRRLSRLPVETNKALAAAAVVGSRFSVELVERIVDEDLVDAFDEACKAGIVIEEPGGHYRFNHALIRQALLAELPSVRRMRLHQRIAATLEAEPGADDELLADLAHHYFECAWAGNAAKAVEYCRRAADQAMARLAYEGAADLYDHALHALEELDEELPDRADQTAELLVSRCEALLAAGDMASAAGAVAQLREATRDSDRLAAWATCFDGQLSMLIHPERLDEVEVAVEAAADKLAELNDRAGEAKAHTVRAGCLARLGRIGDCEIELDRALTAARGAQDHRRVNAVLAGAPLAALWGPNPVPRAGGRCLDVVRLLRITTDSPAVEATSTRCQAVLEALRGRAAAARRMIESARRTVTELGLRHARLEVEQFAGIVELVIGDAAAAEPPLRKAYSGFRRMGLEADTAETAALLGRACLELGRDAEADDLCAESERLAGHATKAAIAWRTLRARLLSRSGDHAEARRVAVEAVRLAEGTDGLVDHGDACLALATVLEAAGDAVGARAAADRAVALYEQKGAAALAERARDVLGGRLAPIAPTPSESPSVELDNECVRAIRRGEDAVEREEWDEVEKLFATDIVIESRRKITGFTSADVPAGNYAHESRRLLENDGMRFRIEVIAVRGDRLALTRLQLGTTDVSPGAPHDELLHLFGIDGDGRIALQISFDIDDIDAAVAELDARHARLEQEQPRTRELTNAASRVVEHYLSHFATRDWDIMAQALAVDFSVDDRRRVVNGAVSSGRDEEIANMKVIAELGYVDISSSPIATRGDRLVLARHSFEVHDRLQPFENEVIDVVEIDGENQIILHVVFDPDDIDAAFEELDARYLAGEAAPYARVWQQALDTLGEVNRHEPGRMLTSIEYTDHRRVPFAPGDFGRAVESLWAIVHDARYTVIEVHALGECGTLVSLLIEGTDVNGNEVQSTRCLLFAADPPRVDVYEEADIATALARFDELQRQKRRLDNTASRVLENYFAHFPTHEWDTMAAILAENVSVDDRRHVINGGIRHGRDSEMANLRFMSEAGLNITSTAIATRGERLVLSHHDLSVRDWADPTEMLDVVEINEDNQISAQVMFDVEDLDAAIAELDARYLAGEAAAHAPTWDVIVKARRAIGVAPGEVTTDILAMRDSEPNLGRYIETVHVLNDHGAVFITVFKGASAEGFDAARRLIELTTVEGDRISRAEVFGETAVDAATAKFNALTRPAPRLENAASRTYERVSGYFAARDWAAMADAMASDVCDDDRRHVSNGGIQYGRDFVIANSQTAASLGATSISLDVVATRGDRLALCHVRFFGQDAAPEAFHIDALGVVEIGFDERVVAYVAFDTDDIDAAFQELDARYVAREAAAHARTWSLITEVHMAFNRHEQHTALPNYVDHRSLEKLDLGDPIAKIRNTWESMPDLRIYTEAVHHLSDVGAIVTVAAHGATRTGFEAEWRVIELQTIENDRVSHQEIFDEEDLDKALARFDELRRSRQRLENTASRVLERYLAHFAPRDWQVMAKSLAEDFSSDDRRRVVNEGVRGGRDSEIANVRYMAELGCTNITSTPIATRGDRLVLAHHVFTVGDSPESFLTEMIDVVEINAENQIASHVVFDPDEIDAAISELDRRYLAGEAAAHAHTWSVIAEAHAAFNRHELPTITPDFLDHRPLVTVETGDPTARIREMWYVTADLKLYIEVVHCLTDRGAVFTLASHGTSRAGFEAEWRVVELETVEGDLIRQAEIFDEADLEAAVARFDELQALETRVKHPSSEIIRRFEQHFAARDWDALSALFAVDYYNDDRRHVVNAGTRRGRDAAIDDLRVATEVGLLTNITVVVIASRGERLILTRLSASGRDHPAIQLDVLQVIEYDEDQRIAAAAVFDPDDTEAAFAELDARYLAGEAAAHAEVWSVVLQAQAALDQRQELPPTTQDWLNLDHRRAIGFAPGEMTTYLRAMWDVERDVGPLRARIESVHRLDDSGAVFVQALKGSSTEGFDTEWRLVELMTIEGGLVSRVEIWDEADLDAALTRFDELTRPTRRLENAASRVYERFEVSFAARDWNTVGEILASDIATDDRRRVVNAGVRVGRDAVMAEVFSFVEFDSWAIKSDVIATRGNDLVLNRSEILGHDQRPHEFDTSVLEVIEIDAEGRIFARVVFDPDNVDAALAELDRRYLAGEAAARANTWSAIVKSLESLQRRQIPSTAANFVNIDHRRVAAYAPGDLVAYVEAGWELDQDIRTYFECVHRLDDFGAVVTHAARGTSRDGFHAEWRGIDIVTVEGGMVSRCELFDESDLDTALARFDELHVQKRGLENTASRVVQRFQECFVARDWDAMAHLLADDISAADRRPVMRAGVRRGTANNIADWQSVAEVGFTSITSAVVATRGDRLVLGRFIVSTDDDGPDAFHNDVLGMCEIDGDKRLTTCLMFDLDEIDAAFDELDARYLAGEAAAHARTWSAIRKGFEALNKREVPDVTDDFADLDHRRLATIGPGGLIEYLRAMFALPDLTSYVETVHRMTDLGAVVTSGATGSSSDDFAAEWRMTVVFTVSGDSVRRCELFDDTDVDAALARFDELVADVSARSGAATSAHASDSGDTAHPTHRSDPAPRTGRR